MRRLKRLDVQTISPPVVGMRPGEVLAELGLIRLWAVAGMVDLTEVNLRYSCGGVPYQSNWVRNRGSTKWNREAHIEE